MRSRLSNHAKYTRPELCDSIKIRSCQSTIHRRTLFSSSSFLSLSLYRQSINLFKRIHKRLAFFFFLIRLDWLDAYSISMKSKEIRFYSQLDLNSGETELKKKQSVFIYQSSISIDTQVDFTMLI